mgnify:FL=1
MTDEEPSVRDKIMELYLKYGERGLDIDQENTFWDVFDRRYFLWVNPGKPQCPLIKITPEALKLIGKET